MIANTIRAWFDLEETWQLWLVGLGMAGQIVFFGRWVIQWIASEQRGESVVPVAFWWCSLVGASLLLAYFVIDRDPVGMVGQTVGWVIYARNLALVRRKSATVSP